MGDPLSPSRLSSLCHNSTEIVLSTSRLSLLTKTPFPGQDQNHPHSFISLSPLPHRDMFVDNSRLVLARRGGYPTALVD